MSTQKVTLNSGSNTELLGRQVIGHIGGELVIESLQDTQTSKLKNTEKGASPSVPLTVGGVASLNLRMEDWIAGDIPLLEVTEGEVPLFEYGWYDRAVDEFKAHHDTILDFALDVVPEAKVAYRRH